MHAFIIIFEGGAALGLAPAVVLRAVYDVAAEQFLPEGKAPTRAWRAGELAVFSRANPCAQGAHRRLRQILKPYRGFARLNVEWVVNRGPVCRLSLLEASPKLKQEPYGSRYYVSEACLNMV